MSDRSAPEASLQYPMQYQQPLSYQYSPAPQHQLQHQHQHQQYQYQHLQYPNLQYQQYQQQMQYYPPLQHGQQPYQHHFHHPHQNYYQNAHNYQPPIQQQNHYQQQHAPQPPLPPPGCPPPPAAVPTDHVVKPTKLKTQSEKKKKVTVESMVQVVPDNNEKDNATNANNTNANAVEVPIPIVRFCEACDKEFSSLDAFNAHEATHENCSHPGCKFSATKKVVSAHFHASHGAFAGTGYKDIDVEGQSFRVLLGTSPEEVEQWREARRRKFPSAANIENKSAYQEKLANAGGLVDTQMKGKRKKQPTNINPSTKKQKPSETCENSVASTDALHSKDTTNTAALITDDDTSDGVDNAAIVNASADADAGTVADTVAVAVADTNTKENEKVESGDTIKQQTCFNFIRGKCKNGDSCTYKHDATVTREVCTFYQHGRCRNGRRCMDLHEKANSNSNSNGNGNGSVIKTERKLKRGELYMPQPLAGGSRGTLLKKLLEDSITEEENIALQCIRYIAKQKHENL
jgi:hypothetical protein